jgi:hypothetical protein
MRIARSAALVAVVSLAGILEARRVGTGLPAGAPHASQDGQSAMTVLLSAPVVENDLELRIDATAQPAPDTTAGARVQIVSEIRHGGRPLRAVGYAIVNDAGATSYQTVESPPVLKYLDDRRVLYLASADLPPGRYRLTMGAIDEGQHRGRSAHAFDVAAWPSSGPQVGDLVLGETWRGVFRPRVGVTPGAASVGARLEVHSRAADAFAGLTVEVTLSPRDADRVLARQALTLTATTDRTTRSGVATFDVASVSAGEYILTAVIRGPTGEIARKTKTFTR